MSSGWDNHSVGSIALGTQEPKGSGEEGRRLIKLARLEFV